MGKQYFLVFFKWEGNVSYGIDEETYLAKIYRTKEAADAYMESQKCKDEMALIMARNAERYYEGGSIDVYCQRFTSNRRPAYVSGAFYLE